MNKINILYIIDVFPALAGAERNLYEIVKNINKEEFTPYVFALKAGDELKEIGKLEIYTKALDIDKIYNLNGLRKSLWLIKFIKTHKIDIIVSYHEGSDILAILIGKLAGIRVIISSRRDLGYKLKKLHIAIYRLFNRMFFKIITVSDAVAKAVQVRENVSEDKTITIYNGVDFARTAQDTIYSEEEIDTLKIEKDSLKIGVLATFRKVKGLEYFIKAARRIKENRNNVQFLIIGKTSNTDINYFNELSKLSDNNVTFIEFQRDIAKIINLLDIVVLPSLSEGFSNTLIEAMAAGKPVVATNVGGNPEAVIDGLTGILVPPANETDLAEAILKLIDNKDLRIKMGEKGKEEAQSRFNLQKMIRINEVLYYHLLNNHKYKRPLKIQLKRIFKLCIASILYYSGLLKLLALLRKRSGSVIILAYHNIVKNSNNYLNLDITIESFRKQLAVISNYFKIVPLSEGLDILQKGQAKDNYLCITFDEGYKGVYQYLQPLLVKQDIPITIFITTRTLEGNNILWFDELIYLISNTKEKVLDLRKYGLGTNLLSNIDEKRTSASIISLQLKQCRNEEIKSILSEIRHQLCIFQIPQAQEVYLSKENIEELMGSQVTIGSHTINHPILTKLSLENLQNEIQHSKQILEKMFGAPIDLFAYPNGTKNDFNNNVIEELYKAGYKAAFTLIKRQCILPYQIGRFGVYEHPRVNVSVFVFDLVLNMYSKRYKEPLII